MSYNIPLILNIKVILCWEFLRTFSVLGNNTQTVEYGMNNIVISLDNQIQTFVCMFILKEYMNHLQTCILVDYKMENTRSFFRFVLLTKNQPDTPGA